MTKSERMAAKREVLQRRAALQRIRDENDIEFSLAMASMGREVRLLTIVATVPKPEDEGVIKTRLSAVIDGKRRVMTGWGLDAHEARMDALRNGYQTELPFDDDLPF